MRKLLVVLLCLLAVFAIVSCKHEPDPVDPPAPGPLTPEEGKTYYRLTATRAAKRFAFMYSGEDGLEINPKIGDTLVVTYRTNHEVTTLYLRDALESVAFAKKVDIDAYVSEPDAEGWISEPPDRSGRRRRSGSLPSGDRRRRRREHTSRSC